MALAMSSTNFQELETKFNVEINKAHNWLLSNGLSIHYIGKTQYMLIKGQRLNTERIGNTENFKITMGNYVIE